MPHQLDFLELEDRARQAESLLGHAIFGEAVRGLRQSYLEGFERIAVGTTTAADQLLYQRIKLQVLAEVVTALQHYVNDYTFAKQRVKVA